MINDLRDWISAVERLGDLKRVEGAHWDGEIGAIVDLYQRQMGLPALLFDRVPGYPEGYRILANSMTSVKRIALSFGLDPAGTALDVVRFWRRYEKEKKKIAPRIVAGGPVLENVQRDGELDLWKFPVPKWHELDGGRFIGTGCLVIMQDPDSEWINAGVYRVQAHDRDLASVMISRGKHGDIIMQKYFERGRTCPVVVTVGQDPLLYMVGGMEVPYGTTEYDVAGGLRGHPLDLVRGDVTGLPFPNDAEIVLEGEIRPGDVVDEGPFGEWTGYYASGVRRQPVIRVKRVYHRDDPIILGAVPAPPPCDDTYYRGFLRVASVWDQLEGAGIPGVKGVWAHEAGGGRFMLTVAIQQLYPGHAKQVGLVASQVHAAAYANRYTIVVDEDIDPTDINQVIWALSTRVDPQEDVDIIKRCWSTALDPMSYPRGENVFNSRMIIDACRPWERLKDFPAVARASEAMVRRVREKWPELFRFQ